MVALSTSIASFRKMEVTKAAPRANDRTRRVSLESFNELVLAHQDAVYRQAYWLLGDEAAAEDAVQEAFLRAYCNMDTYNGGPFRAWVMRIATNYCLDQLRRRKIRQTVALEAFDEYDQEMDSPAWLRDPGASVEELAERAEEEDRIVRSIQSLSPDYRAALVLVDLQGMDYSEAAETLGVPMGTFKSRLSRARVQVQRHLSRWN